MPKTATPDLDLMGCIDAIDKAAQITLSLQYISAEVNDLSPLPADEDDRARLFAQSATQMHLLEFLESTIQTVSAALNTIAKATA